MRDVVTASHGVGAHGDSMYTRDPGRAGRGANGRVGITVRVSKALHGQLIQVGRAGIGRTITTEPLCPVVLAVHPQDIRPIRRIDPEGTQKGDACE